MKTFFKELYWALIVPFLQDIGLHHRCEDNMVDIPFDENYVGIDRYCSVCGEPE